MSTLSTGSRFNSEEGTGKLTVPYQRSNERVGVLQTPSWNQPVTGIDASKTAKPFERVPTNSTPNEPSEDLLAGPAVVQSSGGGGTSNDLDWNDERRRREEARENQYDHKPFKRRR